MNRIAKLRRSEEGFTLIELLVVVAIIALLATFAVPKLFDAINKSKKAPGQADVQTISAAFDRYYMDKNTYPAGPVAGITAAAIKDALTTNGYLKSATTFYNGYEKGYIYVSDASGNYFILLDAQNRTGSVTIQCGAAKHEQAVTIADKDLAVARSATIVAADVQEGCKAGTGTGATFAEFAPVDGKPSYSIATN